MVGFAESAPLGVQDALRVSCGARGFLQQVLEAPASELQIKQKQLEEATGGSNPLDGSKGK